MKREKITISENGIITLLGNPTETIWMRDFEIAELFGVMIPTIKSNIRTILKSRPATIVWRYLFVWPVYIRTMFFRYKILAHQVSMLGNIQVVPYNKQP